MEIFLGKPNQAVVEWCKKNYPVGPTETPYVYFGSNGADHEHKMQITKLTGYFDDAEFMAIGEQHCINGDVIPNYAITYLSSDTGCTLTEIGYNAFYMQSVYSLSLRYVNLPTVLSVGGSAFSACSLNAEIHFPNAKYIGGYAFSDNEMSQNTVIDLPSVTTIDDYAFFKFNGTVDLSKNPNFTKANEQQYRNDWGMDEGTILFIDS